jgi:hypothetical protein
MSDIKNQVNTYIYAAQVLAGQSKKQADVGFCKASIVGASSSLIQAWGAWLEELASYLKVPTSEIEDESSAQVSNLPDCQFLFALKRESGSWYQHLSALVCNPLYFYEREFAQAQKTQVSPEQASVELIAVSTTDHEHSDKSLPSVIDELKAYIQQTREQQTEW